MGIVIDPVAVRILGRIEKPGSGQQGVADLDAVPTGTHRASMANWVLETQYLLISGPASVSSLA